VVIPIRTITFEAHTVKVGYKLGNIQGGCRKPKAGWSSVLLNS